MIFNSILFGLMLLLGFWIARLARDLIRSIVVQTMPANKRIQENAFLVQSRISTAVGLFLAFGLAIAAYAGVKKGIRAVSASVTGRVEKPEAIEPPKEADPLSTVEAVFSTGIPDTVPEGHTWPTADHPSAPTSRTQPGGAFYLQVHAFIDETKAWRQHDALKASLRREIWVGLSSSDPVPYKVLIGPFASREEAIRFRDARRMEGFPKTSENLQLYTR
jgi:hypothetical protein